MNISDKKIAIPEEMFKSASQQENPKVLNNGHCHDCGVDTNKLGIPSFHKSASGRFMPGHTRATYPQRYGLC